MSKLIATSALVVALAALPSGARAQEQEPYDPGPEAEATPDGGAPAWTPPAPPEAPPAAPQAQAQQAPVPPGQWVYTAQYGWIWMPWSDAYTQVPADGWGQPYAYVYAPAYSTWTWVAAPWVWGFGPWPVFGAWGPARFAWYGHGWWRYPSRWHYAPARAWYPGGGWRAPVPYRAGAAWAPPLAPGRGGFGAVRGGVAFGGHGLRGGGFHGGGGGRGGGFHGGGRHR